MSKHLMVLLAGVLAVGISLAQDNKEKPRIEGSGKIVTKEFSVSSFDKLDAKGVFNILLIQGNKEEVKIEADDNLQDLFEVKNEGSVLHIDMKKNSNFHSKKKLKVYVTFKKLKSMDLKTVGDISSENNLDFDDLKISSKSVGSVDLKMTARNLDVKNESVGSVRLNGKADHAVIKSHGVGSVQAASFIVQTMDIEVNGVGSAEVNAQKELKVKDSFLGKVTNRGAATAKKIKRVEI